MLAQEIVTTALLETV